MHDRVRTFVNRPPSYRNWTSPPIFHLPCLRPATNHLDFKLCRSHHHRHHTYTGPSVHPSRLYFRPFPFHSFLPFSFSFSLFLSPLLPQINREIDKMPRKQTNSWGDPIHFSQSLTAGQEYPGPSPHAEMSWTVCYDDDCEIHLCEKQGSGWFPKRKGRKGPRNGKGKGKGKGKGARRDL
ncbi:hypothetical protein HOY82DRAFT_672794, partial [Tuber indicum]